MKRFKVTIYPITPWTVEVEAETEKEAKEYALGLEGPTVYALHDMFYDDTDEWRHDILEWPNIGPKGQVDVEKV